MAKDMFWKFRTCVFAVLALTAPAELPAQNGVLLPQFALFRSQGGMLDCSGG